MKKLILLISLFISVSAFSQGVQKTKANIVLTDTLKTNGIEITSTAFIGNISVDINDPIGFTTVTCFIFYNARIRAAGGSPLINSELRFIYPQLGYDRLPNEAAIINGLHIVFNVPATAITLVQ